MSTFHNYTINNSDVSHSTLRMDDSLAPLQITPQISQSSEITKTDEEESEVNGEDFEDNDAESNLSFEFYQDTITRDKLLSQIQTEGEFEVSKFLLNYYKYWSLSDLSTSLGKLLENIDNDLIELVNQNYLGFINLGKSVDGSLDLIHDIKIDLVDYLKNLKANNESIDRDLNLVERMKTYRLKISTIKNLVSRVIKLSEMIECFDKLCSQFDNNLKESNKNLLKELVGLYFGINKSFYELIKKCKKDSFEIFINSGILINLNKKMNGLKLEFKSLLDDYLNHLKKKEKDSDTIFEIFKLYQLLNCTQDFKNLFKK